jgi:regulator of protease activity HflC (stomatin/prohibitin superfamily)
MNFKRIALGAALLLTVSACSYVPAGNVGVKVNLLGGDKGVDNEVVGVGRYWLGWNEELYLFPTFMQNYVWTAGVDEGSPNDESISFQTADGMTANADIGISYSIDPDKVAVIFQTYRRGVEEITDTFLRNMVRDALVKQASNKPIEYVYGAGKADLIAAVQKDVADQVAPLGIMIGKIYWIGEIRLPPVVLDSINNKNAATQMAQQRQNEVAQAKAEADKKIEDARGVAESILKVAEAQAKANKVLAESITPEFIQYQALEKWDGKLPTTMVPGQATPFISVK